MGTHTPGPWTTGAGRGGIAVVARGWEIPHVATVSADGHSTEAALANAALIAAAPDMLKVLDEAFNFLGAYDGAVEIRERILAVLNKAEGA
jgi:hypothetical protein